MFICKGSHVKIKFSNINMGYCTLYREFNSDAEGLNEGD
jgi:hypothetical protein